MIDSFLQMKCNDLRKVAEGATKGSWTRSGIRGKVHSFPKNQEFFCVGIEKESFIFVSLDNKTHSQSLRDAEYIARANPEVILEILDYVKELENKIESKKKEGL